MMKTTYYNSYKGLEQSLACIEVVKLHLWLLLLLMEILMYKCKQI